MEETTKKEDIGIGTMLGVLGKSNFWKIYQKFGSFQFPCCKFFKVNIIATIYFDKHILILLNLHFFRN